MAVTESFVGVAADGPGKKIDNCEVTTSAGAVQRQGTVLADPETPAARTQVTNTTPASGAYGAVVRPIGTATETTLARRYGATTATKAKAVAAAGDNVVHTPAAGKRVVLHWVHMSCADSGSEVLARVRFSGQAEADDVYRIYLHLPAEWGHWQAVQGAIDAALIVNLSAARTVQVNYTLEEL